MWRWSSRSRPEAIVADADVDRIPYAADNGVFASRADLADSIEMPRAWACRRRRSLPSSLAARRVEAAGRPHACGRDRAGHVGRLLRRRRASEATYGARRISGNPGARAVPPVHEPDRVASGLAGSPMHSWEPPRSSERPALRSSSRRMAQGSTIRASRSCVARDTRSELSNTGVPRSQTSSSPDRRRSNVVSLVRHGGGDATRN